MHQSLPIVHPAGGGKSLKSIEKASRLLPDFLRQGRLGLRSNGRHLLTDPLQIAGPFHES